MRQRLSLCSLLIGAGVAMAANAAAPLPDFAAIVARVEPVVVNISAVERLPAASAEEEQPGDAGDDGSDPLTAESLGSGFIISADGEVLTNYHVIRNAAHIRVRLADRRVLPARLLGADPATDVALLKIRTQALPVAAIGDARRLRAGQWVIAIGSPFGFDHSVTAGIVSAQGRVIGSERYVPYIQTDVPINPGSSGGPLFDLHGRVVGMNAEIYSDSGGYQGVSFAIPINLAIEVARQLRRHGRVVRGWLGVDIVDVQPEAAAALHLAHPQGALVRRVSAGSPAARAGLRPGDVIVAYDGVEVANSESLPPLVGATMAGSRVRLAILRAGHRRSLQVQIGVLPAEEPAMDLDAMPGAAAAGAAGLVVRALSPGERRRYRLSAGGVLVERVAPQGPAQAAGFRKGDVLLDVNGAAVSGPREFARLSRKLSADRPVAVRIRRGEDTLFLPLRGGG